MINIFGKNVLYEAVKSGQRFHHLYLREDVYEKDKKFLNMASRKGIKVDSLGKEKMNQLFPGLNQGYGAVIEDIRTYEISELICHEKKQLFMVLDQLEDPNNLGAIIRSADAFSIDGIIIPDKKNVGITPTVVKVSTGAIFHVKLAFVGNINQIIDKLKKENVWVVGADMDADINLKDLKFDRSLAVVIGSEGFGIRDMVKKNCDYMVKIPMTGHVNSLNASVSAGIIISTLVNS